MLSSQLFSSKQMKKDAAKTRTLMHNVRQCIKFSLLLKPTLGNVSSLMPRRTEKEAKTVGEALVKKDVQLANRRGLWHTGAKCTAELSATHSRQESTRMNIPPLLCFSRFTIFSLKSNVVTGTQDVSRLKELTAMST